MTQSPTTSKNNASTPRMKTSLIVDLSHTIEDGLITYKGLPAPIICDYLSREESKKLYEGETEFQIGKIIMVGNTGTYIDCPFHRYAHGKDFSELDANLFTDLPAVKVIVPYSETKAVTEKHLQQVDIRNKALLVETGWSRHWNTESYFENHSFLTEAAAAYARDQQVLLIGIDSHNIDDTSKKSRPVHSILLANDIFVVEHLCNLDNVPSGGFAFTALPPKIKGIGTFPVRAIAKIDYRD
jgi:kynurenine formamidase